jgi:hypothetical protein
MILSTSLPAVGATASTVSGDTITVTELSFVGEAVSVYETGYFLLTGERPTAVPTILSREDYFQLIDERFGGQVRLKQALAFCCDQGSSGLKLIINGSLPSPQVVGTLGHEAGHARQRLTNFEQSGSTGASNLGAIREAEAYVFQAAVMRQLGEYTGINATTFPFGYELREWVDAWFTIVVQNIDDVTLPHTRAFALPWMAVLHDPALSHLKLELEANGILSPASLLAIYDRFVSLKLSEADSYVAGLLVEFNDDRNSIRETLLKRNGTVPEGFFTHNSGSFLYP